MTRPDRESRFDDVDLTALTIVELEDYLSKIVDRHVIIPDPFLARAYELRITEVQAHIHREVAIRNRRETERQDGQADPDARVLAAERVRSVVLFELAAECEWPHRAESDYTRRLADAIADRAAAQLTAVAPLDQQRLREAVVAVALTEVSAATAGSIASRVVTQLTAPPPGHVCPAPYALGPEDLDVLDRLRERAHGASLAVLNKIFRAHTCPEPTIEPLPELIACGTSGCVSSIKKTYLPSGWRLTDGVWACPRCKVLATTEAS